MQETSLCDMCDDRHYVCCLCNVNVCARLGDECMECKKFYCDDCASQLLILDEYNNLNRWDGNQFLFCGCHLKPDPNKEYKQRNK